MSLKMYSTKKIASIAHIKNISVAELIGIIKNAKRNGYAALEKIICMIMSFPNG